MKWIVTGDAATLKIRGWSARALFFLLSTHSSLFIGLRSPRGAHAKILVCTLCSDIRMPDRWTISEDFKIRRGATNRVVVADAAGRVRITGSAAAVENVEAVRSFYRGPPQIRPDRLDALLERFGRGDY
jgi:hypothetical protein